MKGILGVSLAVSLAVMTQPSNARAAGDSCGATIYSQVGTATIVSCPPLSTSNSEGCLLKLSFLQCEKKKGDSAIRINPGDLVVWDSDIPNSTTGKNYKFRFHKFVEVYKSAHAECPPDPSPGSPPSNDKEPFPNLTGEMHRRNHAAYVDTNATMYACFQHDIYIGDDPQNETALDPHVIIGDGSTGLKHDHDRRSSKSRKVHHSKTTKVATNRGTGGTFF